MSAPDQTHHENISPAKEVTRLWLRWCNRNGKVISAGAEGQEMKRQRFDRLAERLQAMGINPDEI